MKKLFFSFLLLFSTITIKTITEQERLRKRILVRAVTLTGLTMGSIGHLIPDTEDPHSINL